MMNTIDGSMNDARTADIGTGSLLAFSWARSSRKTHISFEEVVRASPVGVPNWIECSTTLPKDAMVPTGRSRCQRYSDNE